MTYKAFIHKFWSQPPLAETTEKSVKKKIFFFQKFKNKKKIFSRDYHQIHILFKGSSLRPQRERRRIEGEREGEGGQCSRCIYTVSKFYSDFVSLERNLFFSKESFKQNAKELPQWNKKFNF